MREKLQTLPLAQLKELAKSQGIRGLSSMKKSEIIDLLCQKAQEQEEAKTKEEAKEPSKPREEAETRGRREFPRCVPTGNFGNILAGWMAREMVSWTPVPVVSALVYTGAVPSTNRPWPVTAHCRVSRLPSPASSSSRAASSPATPLPSPSR